MFRMYSSLCLTGTHLNFPILKPALIKIPSHFKGSTFGIAWKKELKYHAPSAISNGFKNANKASTDIFFFPLFFYDCNQALISL